MQKGMAQHVRPPPPQPRVTDEAYFEDLASLLEDLAIMPNDLAVSLRRGVRGAPPAITASFQTQRLIKGWDE